MIPDKNQFQQFIGHPLHQQFSAALSEGYVSPDLIKEIEQNVSESALIASNTSSISIAALAEEMKSLS